jgi:hypothetical protein
MPKLCVIKKALYHGGKEFAVGQEFTATPVDAAYLKKTGRAEDHVERAPVGEVASTVAPDAPTVDDTEATETARPARHYRNRRLTTED